ncbi:hypothetical protein [Streptomyces sp. NBC_00091]|uniref:hypothetical protein n=1 Tax=Streptomyces sp. NBC_00091 TaxID=2975648 RepID=UPI002258775E|nr:hypothetical protein [Streptomyces sp. NBC_00091]MCX5376365.1 hypothetical protein [Streptomyces sp. NBC_00091]
MADEHNAWLDRATADELLRGGVPGPDGPGADPRARAEAARLRAALDALAPPRPTGAELPGEEAALAAFRAARAKAPATAAAAGFGAPAAGGAHEPLVDLAPVPAVRIPAQRRPARPPGSGWRPRWPASPSAGSRPRPAAACWTAPRT